MTRNAIRVGNAPCSWGALEFEETKQDQIGYERMLDELVQTGYTGTELGDWGYMPTDPGELQIELEQRELTMVGAFVPIPFKYRDAHEDGEVHALRVARLLDAVADVGDPDHKPLIVLSDDNGAEPVRTQNAGRVTPEMGLSDTEWETFAAGIERVARAVHDETGLDCVFHHHCAGYVETPAEIERLLDLTDPELIGLCFDTGHFAFGAGGCDDVVPALDRFASRLQYVHFKDYDPTVGERARAQEWDYFEAVRHGVFCELGRGCVDFSDVVDRLRDYGYGGWITVEQDVLPGMGQPKESARRNRAYLREIGLS